MATKKNVETTPPTRLSRIKASINVEDFVGRLTSRKWFLTIFVCLYFMWRGEPAFDSLTQVVIAFLAIQGGTDALARLAEVRMTGQPSTQSYREGSDFDPEVITSSAALETNHPPGD